MKISYTSDSNTQYVLEYLCGRPLRYYRGIGISYPDTTQCNIYRNNFLIATATVTRHYFDDHNQNFAYRLATKKAMDNVILRSIRKEIWKKVLDKFK